MPNLEQKKNNKRLALVLATIALVFFAGIVGKKFFLG